MAAMPLVNVNDLEVHYRESGEGSNTVLFVHALGTSMRIWDAVVERMKPDRRCILYDLRGHGKSTVTNGPYSIALLAADLLGLMDVLNVAKATICGVSIGGLIAQKAALDRPDRIDGLVLCDTGAKIGSPAAWQDRIRLVGERGLADMSGDIVARWYSPGFRRKAPGLCDDLRSHLATMSPIGYLGACHALRDADLSREVGRIRTPVLIACGADDVATPPALARDLASMVPHARLEIIPDVGHLPCVESPERLADLIGSFLMEARSV